MHSSPLTADQQVQIDHDGYAVVRVVFGRADVDVILASVESSLRTQSDHQGSIRGNGDLIYAARNLLSVWPGAITLAQDRIIRNAVSSTLGNGCGLVRALYFDKPPGRSWSLPWHKDMTIAVRDNALPSGHFCKPTTKAGVPHVEAPRWLLDRMLTARIHLDDITDENGPLRIVPGSHRSGKEPLDVAAGDPRVRPILVSAGDVLLMRPLVVHASGNSRDGTWRHRRIVHLEFAADERLPDGYDWFDYRRLVVG